MGICAHAYFSRRLRQVELTLEDEDAERARALLVNLGAHHTHLN